MYTFEVSLYHDASAVTEAVQRRQATDGYRVQGTPDAGTVFYTGPMGGQYAIGYAVSGPRVLSCTVLQCPWYVAYVRVEDRVRQYLGRVQEDLSRQTGK